MNVAGPMTFKTGCKHIAALDTVNTLVGLGVFRPLATGIARPRGTPHEHKHTMQAPA